MELSFEKAAPADAERICSLCKELIDRYEDLTRIDYNKVLGWVRRKIENNIGEYTCVLWNGEKVGYYRFQPNEERMELDDLYVFETFQNRGIGTEILKKCIRETGKPIFLYVFRKNIGAIALYERMGFRVTETVDASRFIMTKSVEESENG